MKSTKDVDFKPAGIYGLFKGIPGAGKSTAAFSFPKPLVIDFDNKMPAIAVKHYPNKRIDWENPIDIFDFRDIMKKFEHECEYETIIFDSVTSMSTSALNSIGKMKGEDVMKMLANPVTKKGSTEKMVDSMGFDYYNGEKNFFERGALEMAKKLYIREGNPRHVIFLAHVLSTTSHNIMTNQDTETRSIVTAGKQAATMVEKDFDETYMFELKRNAFDGASRVVKFVPTQKDMARSSYRFPNEIELGEKETFYEILNKIAKWE